MTDKELFSKLLPPEPDDNNPDKCIIIFRLPDGEKIKDNEDNVLPTLVNEENTIEYKGEKGYELNIEYVNTTLKTKIPTYEGVTFYVVEGDLVKVKLDSTPDWWNSNYDGLKI